MEPQNTDKHKNIALFGLVVGAFILGYFLYPQINRRSFNNYRSPMMLNDGREGTYGRGMMGAGAYSNLNMGTMMQTMIFGMQGKVGDDFDAAFLREMIPHHQGAIEMARLVLATSKRPELIKLANDIITNQQKEIDTMVSWQRTWFGK